jgi:thiamine-monophosphate kinase
MSGEASEFEIIRRYLAPLSANEPGAFSLTDDAAIIKPSNGCDLVIAKDALVAGVHFLKNDRPEDIARKILRVNLSDMAAMGARPVGYLLATFWPKDITTGWIERFALGLADDQKRYDISLVGGDTVKSDNDMAFSVTMFGDVRQGTQLRRNGAGVGDIVYVSGTIGDGYLGLKSSLGALPQLNAITRDYLEKRYCLPEPRIELGQRLTAYATSCLDVSDGLLADLSHISEQSGIHIDIFLKQIPVSDAAQQVLGDGMANETDLITGGDDYELAFTAPRSQSHRIQEIASDLDLQLTAIGQVKEGEAVGLIDENGTRVEVSKPGWVHF